MASSGSRGDGMWGRLAVGRVLRGPMTKENSGVLTVGGSCRRPWARAGQLFRGQCHMSLAPSLKAAECQGAAWKGSILGLSQHLLSHAPRHSSHRQELEWLRIVLSQN